MNTLAFIATGMGSVSAIRNALGSVFEQTITVRINDFSNIDHAGLQIKSLDSNPAPTALLIEADFMESDYDKWKASISAVIEYRLLSGQPFPENMNVLLVMNTNLKSQAMNDKKLQGLIGSTFDFSDKPFDQDSLAEQAVKSLINKPIGRRLIPDEPSSSL